MIRVFFSYFWQFMKPNDEKESIILVNTRITSGNITPLETDPNVPMLIKIQSTLVAH